MKPFDQLADEKTIDQTISALKDNGIDATVVSTGAEAKEKVLSITSAGIPVPFKGGEECAARRDASLLASRRHLLS